MALPQAKKGEVFLWAKDLEKYKDDLRFLDMMQLWYRDLLYAKRLRSEKDLIQKDKKAEIFRSAVESEEELARKPLSYSVPVCSFKCNANSTTMEVMLLQIKGELDCMIEVVGIRFKKAVKCIISIPMVRNWKEVVLPLWKQQEALRYGAVIKENTFVPEETIVPPLEKVLRPATAEDAKVVEANAKKEEEAFRICLQKIARLELDMKLVDVEMTFDKNKLIFYFTSDGRNRTSVNW